MRVDWRGRIAWLKEQWRSGAWRNFLLLQLEVKPYLQAVPYLLAAVLVGIWASAYSSAFTLSIGWIQHFEARHPYWLLVLAPLAMAFAAALVHWYAPAAGGTGVPRVSHALELDPQTAEAEIDSLLNLRVALVVAASSILGVFGASSLGREGPMVHMAACLFYVTGRQFQKLWPKFEHRSWIVAGGAAGIAAAFNAPLAGVVFVLEELSHQHFHRFKTAVLWAAIVAGVVSQGLSGRYLFLGYPRVGDVPLSALPWAVLVGILCGALAVPFHLMTSPQFQQGFKGYFRTRTAIAFAVGLIGALLAVFLNSDVLGGGVNVINELLFEGKHADWTLIVGRFLGTIFSTIAGTAGGFLAPSLALGAAVGSKVAAMADYPSPNLLVMVGMSAFLSAVIRAPFTAWVIVMEMTDRHSAIFPLMVASLTSFATARLLTERRRPSPPATSGV